MDLKEIRKIVIIALFSDDVLMERFVLKGGNALDIIHNIGNRSSIDIDVSISDDFTNLDDAKSRVFKSLKDRFDASGYVVFDETFEPRPSIVKQGKSIRWGGYQIEFKLIDKASFEKYQNDLEKLRRNATFVTPNMHRKFKIDISKYEYCDDKQETELDSFTIYVYSLPMIAIEKLRAICQQMPEYKLQSYTKARARDFYDIYRVITEENIVLTSKENIELIKQIFEAKEVPLDFIFRIKDFRDFHRADWDAVIQSVSGELKDFDFYFDFVVNVAKELNTIGIK
jgi:predicted nucleotidyltransferase component of viral defense system